MSFLDLKITETPLSLDVSKGAPEQTHIFERESVLAINAAIAAKRPLLVRGEPGTGKTQLARAAAAALGWAFIPYVIDSRIESSDLLYNLDAVSRLGEAQITAAIGIKSESNLRKTLAEERFVHPGPIWWAFNYESAAKQAKLVKIGEPGQLDGGEHQQGCVLLIDEIDKADADLPNGLLDAFGNGQFQVPGRQEPVVRDDRPLLMVVTTNEERALPDAFQRRCLVLHLRFEEGEKLIQTFIQRGRAHFPDASQKVLKEAADQVAEERKHWREKGLAAPGLAEYLDLLRALTDPPMGEKEQLALLKDIKKFVLKKHPEA